MSYTGRVDDMTIKETDDGLAISTVNIPMRSIDNLIAALRDLQSSKRDRW